MTNVEKLKHAGAAFRLNGMVACLDSGKATDEEIALIKEMKADNFILGGRSLGMYAHAVLHILGIEEYQGSNQDIKDFITSMKK